MRPQLILIAGPNGAGKSTLYQARVAPSFVGPFVNADIIQRDELGDPSMQASYTAAEIAAERRAQLLEAGRNFVTETVFSHPSKLEIIEVAKARGYDVILMHIGLESADLSVARVAQRSHEGGHNVPEEKIRARYLRGQSLIRQAVLKADHGWVYDNSVLNAKPKRNLAFESGVLKVVRPILSQWVLTTYAEDLSAARK